MRYLAPISGRARKRPPPSEKITQPAQMILHIVGQSSSSSRWLVIFKFAHRRARDRAFSGGRAARLYIEKFGSGLAAALEKENQRLEYSLGSFAQFGGFVALPQLAPMDINRSQGGCGSRAASADISARQKIIWRCRSIFQFAARVRVSQQ